MIPGGSLKEEKEVDKQQKCCQNRRNCFTCNNATKTNRDKALKSNISEDKNIVVIDD